MTAAVVIEGAVKRFGDVPSELQQGLENRQMAAIQTAGALEPKKQGSASVLSGPNPAQTLTFLLDP